MTSIDTYSALREAQMIRDRKIGAEELLDLHLERVKRRQDELFAFVVLIEERARRQARRIDAKRSSWPTDLPAFWGVPFAIKDNDPMRFTRIRVGSRAFRWGWTPFDSPSVKLLRAAGFVMIGKTTCSELAILPVVEPDIHPPTRNPWNTAHSSGGSSGGASAAVSSGMLPIAHAADGGGSIRIPAAFCHLFGFKASRGLTADFYGAFDVVGLSVGGAIAQTVDDSAALMDALCGQPIAGDLAKRCLKVEKKPLEIRVCLDTELASTDPQIAASVENIGRALERMGHHVKPGAVLGGSLDDFLQVFGRLAANVPVIREQVLQPVTRWLRTIGRTVDKQQAIAINTALAQGVLEWFGDADIWITPTVPCPAPRVNEFPQDDPETCFRSAAKFGSFTAPFNVTGQPAATIPTGVSADGLPFGVQIVGRPGADAMVLALARELEQAGHWSDAKSPMRSA